MPIIILHRQPRRLLSMVLVFPSFNILKMKMKWLKYRLLWKKSKKKTAIKLPDYYTDIKPTNDGKPEPPQAESVASISSILSYDDFEWLNNLNSLSDDDSNERYSFSAFHSQQMKD